VRRKFGSALQAIRQEWALSSKETVPVVSPALLVKFVIFVDIQDLTKKGPPPHWVFNVSALGSFLISILLPNRPRRSKTGCCGGWKSTQVRVPGKEVAGILERRIAEYPRSNDISDKEVTADVLKVIRKQE